MSAVPSVVKRARTRMMANHRGTWNAICMKLRDQVNEGVRYFLAAGIFGTALGLRLVMLPVEAGMPFLTLYPGVALVALICGRGPTVVYILLAAAVGVYAFNGPPWTFDQSDTVPAVAFIAASMTVLLVVHYYQRLVARQTQTLRKLAQAVEQSSESIIITNADANIEYVNQAFITASGFRRDEVMGQNPRLLQSGKTPPATYAAMWEALGQGHAWEGDFINRRKNGSEYIESAVITPIRQADGHVSHYVAVKEDVTERKRDGEELDRHRHHLEVLVSERTTALEEAHSELLDTQFALENVDIGIHWVDADTGKFIHVNKYAAKMLGYTVAEMLDLSVADIVPNYDAERFIENIEVTRRQGGMHFEMSNLTKEGHRVPVEVTLYYLPGEATRRPACVVAFLMNIARRRETESALRLAKQSAEAANAAKTAFLANISHEIRTPLNVIIGLGHLLRRDLTDSVHLDRLTKLCASSEHLLALINDVLDLSKIEAERLTIDSSDFRLGAVVDQVVRLTEGLAHEKGLTLTVDVAPALHSVVLNGDALRLAQVLINLCGNAVKFTDQGEVRFSVDLMSETVEGVKLAFEVADTGIGIKPADQERLFQPFEQADSSTTGRRGGTGLGLAISRRLVASMGGTLRIDSCFGVGTTIRFELVLPRTSASEAEYESAPAAWPVTDFDGRHVLIVEDHLLSQEILLAMVEQLGCVGEVAADGAEAVACAREHTYDLILMDMQMPVMNGLAATLEIRKLPKHQTTPIIALTANAFAEDRKRCLDAGMNGHITKPVTPAMLAAALEKWLPDMPVVFDESPPCDNVMSRSLAKIPGLQVPSSWRYSPQRLDDYCAQVERFVTMHVQDMRALHKHVVAGDINAAHDIAHKIKGVAGLLGAQHIVALTSEIGQTLRSGADKPTLNNLTNACEAELKRLSEAMQALRLLLPADAN